MWDDKVHAPSHAVEYWKGKHSEVIPHWSKVNAFAGGNVSDFGFARGNNINAYTFLLLIYMYVINETNPSS